MNEPLHLMIPDDEYRIIAEASGICGEGGHRRAGDVRMEAEALMGRRSMQRNGWKPNRRGHASPHDRPCVK
jgi:hypothetical protein